jgi:2-keto-4-pentenoate hydratase
MPPRSAGEFAVASQAAALLIEARRGGRTLTHLPPALAPSTAALAYAIQDETVIALGGVAGWKVGARGPTVEPTCAPIPRSLLHESPHRFEPAQLRLRGIEAEFAVRLARDLPARARPYAQGDVQAAVASVHAAIELVESRFEDPRNTDPLSMLADCSSHGALVYGAGASPRAVADPSRARVQLWFGVDCLDDVSGGNPAGDIWRLLVWLANHCAARGKALRAGQVITTGSCTGLRYAGAGTRVRALVEGLSEVEIEV